MRLLHGATLTVAMLLVAAASPAQNLGDAAAKEKERRKTVQKPTKVITDDDLRTGGGVVSSPGSPNTPAPGASPAATKEGAAAGAPAKKEKTADEIKAEAQAEWRKKLDAANAESTEAKGFVDSIQLQLNDTSGGVFTPRRATLQSQLDQANKKYADAQAKVASLTEEGRRNGYR